MHTFDALIIGAGAAGLFCAARAGQRGVKVLLVDHADKLAEKIRISGGGRCNFTNRDTSPAQFLSDNPHFCRSALARYRPEDFTALLHSHRIAFHEKHLGQLFCDGSSQDIIDMLVDECEAGGVTRWQPCAVAAVRKQEGDCSHPWQADTARGAIQARHLVVATGGLPVPQIGATDFGLKLARQFGHRVIEPRPALVPLTFDAQAGLPFASLAGVAMTAAVSALALPAGMSKSASNKAAAGHFVENLLFTHRGLSGPAILQISSYWRPGQPLRIDLLPGIDLATALRGAKARSRRHLGTELATHLPQRLAEAWLGRTHTSASIPLPDCSDRVLTALADSLHRWDITPTGTEGWKKAEVMAGGVDTQELSSQSLQSQRHRGLHFIGEVVDVTGWLGGYNFQWAWASAAACAQALAMG